MAAPEILDFCDRIELMIGALSNVRDHLLGCAECGSGVGCDLGKRLIAGLDEAAASFDQSVLARKAKARRCN